MPTNLGLDDELNTLSASRGTDTRWWWRMLELLRLAFHSAVNPFGSAARADFGLDAGDVPRISGGKIDRRHMAAGAFSAADFDGLLPNGAVPQVPATRLTTGRLADGRIPTMDIGKVTTGVFAVGLFPPVSQQGTGITSVVCEFALGRVTNIGRETSRATASGVGNVFVFDPDALPRLDGTTLRIRVLHHRTVFWTEPEPPGG